MTEAAEVHAALPERTPRLTILAAPALVLLAVVLPFLRFHEYDLLLPESLILMAGAALVGAAVGAIALLRPNTLGPALIALVLCVFALYRPEIRDNVVAGLRVMEGVTGHFSLLLAVASALLFLALMGIGMLLGRHWPTVVTAVFATFAVSTLVLPAPTGGEHEVTGELPAELNDLPPVIHLILDEQIGLAALPPDLEETPAAADAIRKTYGDFALYERAYSRFGQTIFSLSALMNGEPGTDVLPHLGVGTTAHVLYDNTWFDRLKAQGYAIRVTQTAWLDMCGDSDAVDVCDTHPLYSINAVQRTMLPTMARLRVLLGKLKLGGVDALPAPMASMEAFDRFEDAIVRQPRGVAHIAHLILPHYGYLYRSDCSLADPTEWRNQPGAGKTAATISADERTQAYRLYLPQVVCAQRKVAHLFEQLRKQGVFDQATIIVHGDHGSRIAEGTARQRIDLLTNRDLLDHVSALLAIKAPDLTAGIVEEPVDMQHVFAEMFLDREPSEGEPGTVWLQDKATRDLVARTLTWPDFDGGGVAPAMESTMAWPEGPPSLRSRIE